MKHPKGLCPNAPCLRGYLCRLPLELLDTVSDKSLALLKFGDTASLSFWQHKVCEILSKVYIAKQRLDKIRLWMNKVWQNMQFC